MRKTLEDPAYADWYFKFKPQCLSNSSACFSKKCDKAQPSLCSDLFHEQEQSPGYPHGDGDCLAPAALTWLQPLIATALTHGRTELLVLPPST